MIIVGFLLNVGQGDKFDYFVMDFRVLKNFV